MRVLQARNAHQMLPRVLDLLRSEGIKRDSRNGPVLQAPTPVALVYERPREKVVFHSWRAGNPFFHAYEALWMLAGRNDVAPLTRYVKRMADYSDDGVTFNAAYGHRWRHALHWAPSAGDTDQLKIIAANLTKNPDSRQEVLQIWNHSYDLGTATKDHACNIAASFQTRPGVRSVDGFTPIILDMVVFCRSNDAVWGALGANVVHFSTLLEYVAARCFFQVGTYTQVAVNLHAYLPTAGEMLESHPDEPCPYESGQVSPHSLMKSDDKAWDEDCRYFVTTDGRAPREPYSWADPYWKDVALPIIRAHDIYKDRDDPDRYADAVFYLGQCKASDWRLACTQWIHRRYDAFREKH